MRFFLEIFDWISDIYFWYWIKNNPIVILFIIVYAIPLFFLFTITDFINDLFHIPVAYVSFTGVGLIILWTAFFVVGLVWYALNVEDKKQN